jgi:23S rRNA pseudouridine1911/1915/1917 synthase
LAVVDHLPEQEEGELRHWLIKNEEKNKTYAYSKPKKDAKEAILHYKHVASLNRYHLLEIDLKTGAITKSGSAN